MCISTGTRPVFSKPSQTCPCEGYLTCGCIPPGTCVVVEEAQLPDALLVVPVRKDDEAYLGGAAAGGRAGCQLLMELTP